MKLKKFEIEVVNILLANSPILKVLDFQTKDFDAKCEFTHYGYFLTINDSLLPKERTVYSEPSIVGKTDKVNDVGFVLFVENNELTLECFSYSDMVPTDLRERELILHIQEK